MFCHNCGKEIEENTLFCGVCGARIENSSNPNYISNNTVLPNTSSPTYAGNNSYAITNKYKTMFKVISWILLIASVMGIIIVLADSVAWILYYLFQWDTLGWRIISPMDIIVNIIPAINFSTSPLSIIFPFISLIPIWLMHIIFNCIICITSALTTIYAAKIYKSDTLNKSRILKAKKYIIYSLSINVVCMLIYIVSQITYIIKYSSYQFIFPTYIAIGFVFGFVLKMILIVNSNKLIRTQM